MGQLKTAVILAAGMGTRLGARGESRPKGFLRLGKWSIIEESILRLRRSGIERIIIVTGHCREAYDELADASDSLIRTIHNDRYRESGSMYSLFCARHEIDEDFLLLESDLIYEQRALDAALSFPQDNCVLLSGFTESGDEVFVQQRQGRLLQMSKDRSQLGEVSGELVGITKISLDLFSHMLAVAETAFRHDLHYDYETDCLVAAANICSVYCHLVPDLMWAEIDDVRHLERARSLVYPAIVQRDSALL